MTSPDSAGNQARKIKRENREPGALSFQRSRSLKMSEKLIQKKIFFILIFFAIHLSLVKRNHDLSSRSTRLKI